MERPDTRLTCQIPLDAKIIHHLSPILAGVSQRHASLAGTGSQASLPTTIQGLNAAIAQSNVIWELGSTAVLGIGSELVMKAGSDIDIDHIPTMNYIKNRACKAVLPDIHGILQDGHRTFVFMTRLKGESLDRLWKALARTQKESIKNQLRDIFTDIRSIPPPPLDESRAVLGGGIPRRCKDLRRHTRVADGPLQTEAEFNQFLTSHPRRTETAWLAMIRSYLVTDHAFVMTHGDLHPRNIMVVKADHSDNLLDNDNPFSGEFKVTGLIDWEMCGYYPEYWEYVRALHTLGPRDEFNDWWAYLPSSIGVWPMEYAVNLMISQWVG